MFKKVLILTACLLGSWVCELQAVVNSKWVGGDWGEWGNASNWKPGVVPDNNPFNTFAVTIDSIGLDEIEVYLREDRTIDRLDCYGEVTLRGQQHWVWRQLTLEDRDGLTNYGVLGIHAWGVELFGIQGNLTNTSGALVDFWGAHISGDVHNQTGAELQVNGEVDVHDGDVENAGVITIADHELHVDQVHNAGQIEIHGGGCSSSEVLDNNDTGVIRGFGTVYGQLMRNKGQIIAFGGSLVLATGGQLFNSGLIGNTATASLHVIHIAPPTDVNNFGRVEVNAGGSVAFDCSLVNEANGVIELLGGTLAGQTIRQFAGATFKGQGNVTADLVIETDALIGLTGPTNVFGKLQIDPNGMLEISDGTTLITGHTTCNGTIHMKGGRIIPQGGLSGDCDIIWEQGTYSNVADFNLDGQVNFNDFTDFADAWLWVASLD